MTNEQRMLELGEGMSDFNRRFTSIIENDRLGTEGKNLAIGLLVTLNAPFLRRVEASLKAQSPDTSEGQKI